MNGKNLVDIDEVKEYYREHVFNRREEWEKKLGIKLDWELSFEWVPEKERTKHVLRLHPYKGKFIPQLVEYFLGKCFIQRDIILDPFMGSGTTLVQALEMGIHSIGIDISPFNCLIAESKLQDYDIQKTKKTLLNMLNETYHFIVSKEKRYKFEEIDALISQYNKKYFSVDYRIKINSGEINEKEYSSKVMDMFFQDYYKILSENNRVNNNIKGKPFLSKWYLPEVREELLFYLELIKKLNDEKIKKIAMIVLSRTARSVRATTHYDLATLKEPVYEPYYCYKHKKICRPVATIEKHLKRYTYDVIKRIEEFSRLRKMGTYYAVIQGDSRNVNIEEEIAKNLQFYNVYKKKRISGIFTSPPYLGQIDYHEQHAYAYELFEFERHDELEIGPKFKGSNKKSKEEYSKGIVEVLLNSQRFMRENSKIFIVVNDKMDLYKKIFEMADLEIIREFKRPVLNRTSRDRNPYYESIFELKMVK